MKIILTGAVLVIITLFLPFVTNGDVMMQPPTQAIVTRVPRGLPADLKNPNMFVDRTGTVFASTRPDSTVGGIVWMDRGGVQTVVLELGPDDMYALGELFINEQNGWLYYTTIPKADPNQLISYPIMEWTP